METLGSDELRTRSLLPYTDAQILEIYHRAVDEKSAAYSKYEAEEKVRRLKNAMLWDAGLYLLFLGFILHSLPGYSPDIIFTTIVVMALASGLVILLITPCGIGPVSILTGMDGAPKPGTEAVTDEILGRVIEYISAIPLARKEELDRQINRQRNDITRSLQELPSVAQALDDELRSCESESLRILISSRRDVAWACVHRLTALREELIQQSQDAADVVRPVLEIRDKFQRIGKLNGALTRIQAAHGLIEVSEQAISDNRLELQLLTTVTNEATARLQDIASLVEATQKARQEINA